jgi:hypothetical protein
METAARYARFAAFEARGESACYAEWASGVAVDATLLRLLDELPYAKRQPNLLFAAARYAGIEQCDFAAFRAAVLAGWPRLTSIMATHRTQTNEIGRCAALLPLLAALPPPLALLEAGTSAGLCLYPDRYSYQYGERWLHPLTGPAAAVISCATTGPVPVPAALPEVVWRAGIDLNPLDVADADQMRWLTALVWPEHDARRARLAAAIDIARADPPLLVTGDLNDKVAELASQAPPGATLVVFHSSALAYLQPADQARFAGSVRRLRGNWISNEAPGVVAFADELPPPPDPSRLWSVLARDGRPVAYVSPHGQSLYWFD